MRRDASHRLLYSVQFHPEIAQFSEAERDDGGFGQQLLVEFFREAEAWWKTRDGLHHHIVPDR